MKKCNRIKTWTVELVGVVVTVANAIATLTGADASVVAAPLATRVANYACRLISGREYSKAIISRVKRPVTKKTNHRNRPQKSTTVLTCRRTFEFVAPVAAVQPAVATAPDVDTPSSVSTRPFVIGIACCCV